MQVVKVIILGYSKHDYIYRIIELHNMAQ